MVYWVSGVLAEAFLTLLLVWTFIECFWSDTVAQLNDTPTFQYVLIRSKFLIFRNDFREAFYAALCL